MSQLSEITQNSKSNVKRSLSNLSSSNRNKSSYNRSKSRNRQFSPESIFQESEEKINTKRHKRMNNIELKNDEFIEIQGIRGLNKKIRKEAKTKKSTAFSSKTKSIKN